MALGSVGYMSPEQAEGLRVDARSDIFSFGLVLYEMLTGQRAFQRASKLSTLAALLHESPAPLHAHLNEYPPELEALLDRCLHKKPERRFQTSRKCGKRWNRSFPSLILSRHRPFRAFPPRPAPSAALPLPFFLSPISAPIPNTNISATASPRKSSQP